MSVLQQRGGRGDQRQTDLGAPRGQSRIPIRAQVAFHKFRVSVFPERGCVSPHDDAQNAYTASVERARRLREEWERLGRPLLATGSREQPVSHPLLRAMNEAELLAHRLRQPMLRKHRGPEPSAVIGLSPAARLRNARPRGVTRGNGGRDHL